MLQVRGLSIDFSSYSFGLKKREIRAIRSLDLYVEAGEVLAVVGQSGAGKSLLAHALLGVLPKNAKVAGEIRFKGRELTSKDIKCLRGREIALVPQSVTYLNPLLQVAGQIARAAELGGVGRKKSRMAALEVLRRYRLDKEIARCFPFQLSGGMARRILTATATVGGADLIVADEPTNGLDRETAGETLRHLRELADLEKAVILITHDIEGAISVADKIAVFCGGITVEHALASDFNGFGKLRHPYSRALLNALPGRDFVNSLPQNMQPVTNGGCPFGNQCDRRTDRCRMNIAEMKMSKCTGVRCFHA